MFFFSDWEDVFDTLLVMDNISAVDAPYTSAGDASTLQAVTGSFRNAMMRDIEHHVASLEKLLHKIHDVVLVVRPVTSELVPKVLVQQMTLGCGASTSAPSDQLKLTPHCTLHVEGPAKVNTTLRVTCGRTIYYFTAITLLYCSGSTPAFVRSNISVMSYLNKLSAFSNPFSCII